MMKATGLKRGSRKKQQQQQQQQQQQPKQQQTQQTSNGVRNNNGSNVSGREGNKPVMLGQPVQQMQGQAYPPRVQQQQQLQYQQQQHYQQQVQQSRQMHPDQQQYQRRRQPSAEETALTTKNYRLAKELSELRVKHREECKSVTRLTMENMNLASRCREAVSHVAMLKKELAMHQRRAAETLAMQREQTQRMASNLSSEMSRGRLSSQSFSEDESDKNPDIDHILSTITPPRPRPGNTSEITPSSVRPVNSSNVRTVSPRDSDSPVTKQEVLASKGEAVNSVKGNHPSKSGPTSTEKGSLPPKVYSTPNRHRNTERWAPHISGTPSREHVDGKTLFPHSASPKVVSIRNRNYDDEFPPDIIPQPQRSSPTFSNGSPDDEEEDDSKGYSISETDNSSKRPELSVLSSIDAFEASFDATFPRTFSIEKDQKETSVPEIYNPFFSSPPRNGDLADVVQTSTHRRFETTPSTGISPEMVCSASANDPSILATPRTPEESDSQDPNSAVKYHTPPKERLPLESPEPIRPHKTVPPAARARYEKALQPRKENASQKLDPPENENEASMAQKASSMASGLLKGSPSALLKRIHQRRMNKNGKQEEPENSGHKRDTQSISPKSSIQHASSSVTRTTLDASTSPENDAQNDRRSPQPFDEAEGDQTGLNGVKSRRNVKQPVSYAEPALNTKLRQGDTFFPKTQPKRIVTPEQATNPVH